MSQPEDLSIERTTELDLDVDELWALISTAEGWSSWLVDDADLVVAPDCTGSATSDGVVRDVHVDAIIDRSGIGFSWWDRDDPATASYVQLEIVELPNGRSQLNITERFVGAPQTRRCRLDGDSGCRGTSGWCRCGCWHCTPS